MAVHYDINSKKYDIDLKERTFEFAISIILLLKRPSSGTEFDVICYQLAKSGTSVGANYEESQAAESRADFRHKISIALKECRESNYWLRLIKRIGLGKLKDVQNLVKESGELKSILGSIYHKVKE